MYSNTFRGALTSDTYTYIWILIHWGSACWKGCNVFFSGRVYVLKLKAKHWKEVSFYSWARTKCLFSFFCARAHLVSLKLRNLRGGAFFCKLDTLSAHKYITSSYVKLLRKSFRRQFFLGGSKREWKVFQVVLTTYPRQQAVVSRCTNGGKNAIRVIIWYCVSKKIRETV